LGINLPDGAMKGWRYVPEGDIDLRLDLLRGYLIFSMVADPTGEGVPHRWG